MTTVWESETIPDSNKLFMRVHKNIILAGQIPHGVFRDPDGKGMSTDWEAYASPHQTRARGGKPAEEYAVIAVEKGAVEADTPLSVKHTPIAPSAAESKGNRAHTDILGLKQCSNADKTEARVALWRLSRYCVNLNDPVVPVDL